MLTNANNAESLRLTNTNPIIKNIQFTTYQSTILRHSSIIIVSLPKPTILLLVPRHLVAEKQQDPKKCSKTFRRIGNLTWWSRNFFVRENALLKRSAFSDPFMI